MASSHTINPAKRLIVQRFEGTLSLATVCEGTEQLWSDPQYDPTFDGLTDLTHSVVSGNIEDVRALSRFIANSQRASTGRWAVVTNDPKITAFVLVFGRLLAKPSLSVFSTWAAATAFMQVETTPPPPHNRRRIGRRPLTTGKDYPSWPGAHLVGRWLWNRQGYAALLRPAETLPRQQVAGFNHALGH